MKAPEDLPEYEVLMRAIVSSNLTADELERQLVLALWEGMDEDTFIFDGQTEGLKVIEYLKTSVMEV